MKSLTSVMALSVFAGFALASAATAMPIQQRESSPAVGATPSNKYSGAGAVRGEAGRAVKRMEQTETMMMREGGVLFVVRIENISPDDALKYSDGTTEAAAMSHGAFAVFRDASPFYIPGQPAIPGSGIEEIAEDGNVRPAQAFLEANPKVMESGIFYIPVGASKDSELFKGNAYEFEITGDPGDKLTFAAMLHQSNDLFYGPKTGGIDLFGADGKPISGDVTAQIGLLDSGTEVDQDPKFGPDGGVNEKSLNSGPSESDPVGPAGGEFPYPPVEKVLKVTITPL